MHLDYVIPDWPAPRHVRAYTTTRRGGVSKGSFASYNLACHVGDDTESVRANRAQLQRELALPSPPIWLQQVHSNHVIDATTARPGVIADASYTRLPDIVCAVLTADCLPILVTNQQGTEIAAIHAGWRGLTQQIIQNALTRLQTPREQLLAWLGPAIGPTRYEVGEDVRAAAITQLACATHAFTPIRPGHWSANLYLLATQVLNHHGIKQVYGGEYCTYSDNQRFFSYRRDQHTGRMASLIWIDPKLNA